MLCGNVFIGQRKWSYWMSICVHEESMDFMVLEIHKIQWRGVLDTTLYDKVLKVNPHETPVSSTIKTDHHDITEILLKVAINTKKNPTQTNPNQTNTNRL